MQKAVSNAAVLDENAEDGEVVGGDKETDSHTRRQIAHRPPPSSLNIYRRLSFPPAFSDFQSIYHLVISYLTFQNYHSNPDFDLTSQQRTALSSYPSHTPPASTDGRRFRSIYAGDPRRYPPAKLLQHIPLVLVRNQLQSEERDRNKMPSLQTALPPEMANNAIRLYRECLRRAKYVGHKQHNTELVVQMVRQQFRKHMHETDPERIQKLKDE
ncbi:hypothetical protein LXL04_015355 [Taraxacum kok-saghyz]